MPTYDFKCKSCLNITEAILPMDSNTHPVCWICGGETTKMISPAAIIFKGSGFYKTDSTRRVSAKAKFGQK